MSLFSLLLFDIKSKKDKYVKGRISKYKNELIEYNYSEDSYKYTNRFSSQHLFSCDFVKPQQCRFVRNNSLYAFLKHEPTGALLHI